MEINYTKQQLKCLLDATVWSQLPDHGLTPEMKVKFDAYRAELKAILYADPFDTDATLPKYPHG